MRYLTIDELIYINGKVLNNRRILEGEQQIRDIDLLDAAVARPMSSAFGLDAYATIQQKATALLHSVARNHPFADGNKRTATVAAIFMLAVNGLRVNWEASQALALILAVAQGKGDMTDFARWLPLERHEPALEPDAGRDKAMIERIVTDHRWLLDELDRQ